jgi:hypothetical protein
MGLVRSGGRTTDLYKWSHLINYVLTLIHRDIFKATGKFTALRFTTGASLAAKRTLILLMTQHAWRLIMFRMTENN